MLAGTRQVQDYQKVYVKRADGMYCPRYQPPLKLLFVCLPGTKLLGFNFRQLCCETYLRLHIEKHRIRGATSVA